MVALTVREIGDDDVFQDMVRVSGKHRNGVRPGRIMMVSVGAKRIGVLARGPRSISEMEIAMDYETRSRLGVEPGQKLEFQFDKANLVQEWAWGWNATQASYRIAARLSLLSVILGTLGLVLGGVSLFK